MPPEVYPARGKPRAKIFHLLYHEVTQVPGSYTYAVSASELDEHLRLYARLRTEPERYLRPEITFDDGHVSNWQYASPSLTAHGLAARFFLTAGWIGVKREFMDWAQVRSLNASGQAIGAHGWSHKLLTHCTEKELNQELVGARLKIEDEIGAAVTTLSLPGGRSNARVLRACREAGYTRIYTSVPEAMSSDTESVVGRLNIRSRAGVDWIAEVMRPESGRLASLQRQHRIKAALKGVLGDGLYARLWAVLNRQAAPAGVAEE